MSGLSCTACGMPLPSDIDAFSDGRAPCPACGSLKRTFEIFTSDTLGIGVGEHAEALPITPLRGVASAAASARGVLEVTGPRTKETAKETVFTVQVVHPQTPTGGWMVVVTHDNRVIKIGFGEHADEAFVEVVDTIALFDYDADA